MTVRPDLAEGCKYYSDGFNETDVFVRILELRDVAMPDMTRYRGKRIRIASKTGNKYRVETLNGEPLDYNWTDEMFEEYINRSGKRMLPHPLDSLPLFD